MLDDSQPSKTDRASGATITKSLKISKLKPYIYKIKQTHHIPFPITNYTLLDGFSLLGSSRLLASFKKKTIKSTFWHLLGIIVTLQFYPAY